MPCWSLDQSIGGSSVHYTVPLGESRELSCQVDSQTVRSHSLSLCSSSSLSPPDSQTSDIFAMIERMQVRSGHFHPVLCLLLFLRISRFLWPSNFVTPSLSLLYYSSEVLFQYATTQSISTLSFKLALFCHSTVEMMLCWARNILYACIGLLNHGNFWCSNASELGLSND